MKEEGGAAVGAASSCDLVALPVADGLAPYATGRGWVIYCADVLDWLGQQPEHEAALIVCDPPYHRVVDAAWDREFASDTDYLVWLGRVRDAMARALHPAGSLYVWASARMASRVEVLIAERLAVLAHICWVKAHNGAPYHSGCKNRKTDQRSYFPGSERLIFAEHANSDGHAMSGAGYTVACDTANGLIMEPLRLYLDGERRRAGVSPAQVSSYFRAQGWPAYIYRHWFTKSQWEMPTAENYQRLRKCLNALGCDKGEFLRKDYEFLRKDYEFLRKDYEFLRKDYEDLRKDYEDLRRPFRAPTDNAAGWWSDVWTCRPVLAYDGKHPAEKPGEIAEQVVSISSRPGKEVWDLFAGSGTFAAAAVRLGLPAVAVESDPHWCERIAERLRAAERSVV